MKGGVVRVRTSEGVVLNVKIDKGALKISRID